MRYLNLGILAHVDAGKTSLTERLLFTSGVIDAMGRVDDGTTQTDSLALERQRGITIRAAVASFVVGDVTVNLVDTPGHPDFIAEVERSLSVLDGVVLVVSAVEGVQPQTRVLMRTLRRLQIPTVIFVNKIDRSGANPDRVLRAISERLTPHVVALGAASAPGTRAAAFSPYGPADDAFRTRLLDLLSDHSDALLATYVQEETELSCCRLRHELAAQTRRALVHPVFFGSAITGVGVDALIAGVQELLPASEGDAEGPLSGTVFKIERGPAGEKIAYVRLFSGRIRVRDRLRFGRSDESRVTALSVFGQGDTGQRSALAAGQIGKLWGLDAAQIGDQVGAASADRERRLFAPPTLETLIVPRRAADRGALHAALARLAEQDPLINLRRDELREELYVSLYGEVQKEVIQATLADECGVDVTFQETTTICVERPVGAGEAVEIIGKEPNPFLATIGLRVEPGLPASGVQFRLQEELGSIPLFVYKSADAFHESMAAYVRQTLQQGLYGWQVTDCLVTMTHSGYMSPASTAGDFRKLAPLVLISALQQAGTVVCEPLHHFSLELPTKALGPVMGALARLRGAPLRSAVQGAVHLIEGEIPAAQVHALQQQLPGLTSGDGVLTTSFDRYEPVRGEPPTRARFDNNPLNRKEYLLRVLRRV
jgi:ribosomal protection tetracycline resistance protein